MSLVDWGDIDCLSVLLVLCLLSVWGLSTEPHSCVCFASCSLTKPLEYPSDPNQHISCIRLYTFSTYLSILPICSESHKVKRNRQCLGSTVCNGMTPSTILNCLKAALQAKSHKGCDLMVCETGQRVSHGCPLTPVPLPPLRHQPWSGNRKWEAF